MMLEIFDRNWQTLVRRMISPTLNQTNGSLHVKRGSTHMRRRTSPATRDTTEFLLFCSVLGLDGAWVEGLWTDLGIGESNILRTQAFTQTTTYAKNDTYADDYDMPDTYEPDYYFEQEYPYSTGESPGSDEVEQPESLLQLYYLSATGRSLKPSMKSNIWANLE